MASYLNAQASLLRYCTDTATQMKLLHRAIFESVDFEAYSDIENLPKGHLIGIESLGGSSENDSDPLDMVDFALTIGTQDDRNNYLLSRVVDKVYEALKPNQAILLVDAETGVRAGKILLLGTTRVTPAQGGKDGRVYKSVIAQGVMVYDHA